MSNIKINWDKILSNLRQNGVIPSNIHRVLLYGPPRTGKSTTAAKIFEPSERITLHRQQPVDDLLGGYCLVNGTTVWADGPAVRALKNGHALVIDEIDQMSGECRFILHALLDDPPAITLANGERITGKKGYVVIATTNAQPSTLPAPVLDRFDLIIYCNTLANGLKARLGKLHVAAERSIIQSELWIRPASPNLFLSVAKLLEAGMTESEIAALLYPEQQKFQADLLVALKKVLE